jgi:uncharacterized protein
MNRQPETTRFHTMAKPIGPICNLDCTYCFYLHKEQLLSTCNKWRMSDEVLEEFIKQYIEHQNYHEIIFSWQGGEPSLLGLDFFRKVVALEKKYANGKTIQNDLQTNGTLLDDEWCKFLKANNFLVGLSIDGPKRLHDKFRPDKKGDGTFMKVCDTAKRLHKFGVPFNSLTCVNRETAKYPLDVYRFLRSEIKPRMIQFSPVVEPKVFRDTAPQHWKEEDLPMVGSEKARPGHPDSVVTDWSVDPDEFGNFLIKVFDEWYKKDQGKVFVNYFENAAALYSGLLAQMCTLAPICGKGLAIEHDGDIYSCDHYVYPEYKLGNIFKTGMKDMAFSMQQQDFGLGKKNKLTEQCKQCYYMPSCYGECPKNRVVKSVDGEPGHNYLCTGLKKYFEHIDPYMKEIIKNLRKTNL